MKTKREDTANIKVVNFKKFSRRGVGNQVTEIYKTVIKKVIRKLTKYYKKRNLDMDVVQQLRDLWITKIKENEVPNLNIADLESQNESSSSDQVSRVEKQPTASTATFSSYSNKNPLVITFKKVSETSSKKQNSLDAQKVTLNEIPEVALDMPDIASITPLLTNCSHTVLKNESCHNCDKFNENNTNTSCKPVLLKKERIIRNQFCHLKPSIACTSAHNKVPFRQRRRLRRLLKFNNTNKPNSIVQKVRYEVLPFTSQNNNTNYSNEKMQTVLIHLPNTQNESNRTCTIEVHNSFLFNNKLDLILTPLVKKVKGFSVTEAAFILQENINRASNNITQADGLSESVQFRLVPRRTQAPFHKQNHNSEASDIDSADDLTDEVTENEFECENEILCQYKKVSRRLNKYHLELTNGAMHIFGRDYYFKTATGDLTWD